MTPGRDTGFLLTPPKTDVDPRLQGRHTRGHGQSEIQELRGPVSLALRSSPSHTPCADRSAQGVCPRAPLPRRRLSKSQAPRRADRQRRWSAHRVARALGISVHDFHMDGAGQTGRRPVRVLECGRRPPRSSNEQILRQARSPSRRLRVVSRRGVADARPPNRVHWSSPGVSRQCLRPRDSRRSGEPIASRRAAGQSSASLRCRIAIPVSSTKRTSLFTTTSSRSSGHSLRGSSGTITRSCFSAPTSG